MQAIDQGCDSEGSGEMKLLSRFGRGVAVVFLVLLALRASALYAAERPPEASAKLDFADVFFRGSVHGWITATGPTPSLFTTNDGGGTWTRSQLPTRASIYKIYFLTAFDGWGLVLHSQSTSLWSTRDGGQNWNYIGDVQTGDSHIVDFLFTDFDNGWFVGETPGGRGFVVHTADGGHTFALQKVHSDTNCLAVRNIGKHKLWILGASSIAHSRDGGKTWATQYALPGQLFYDGSIFASGRGWVAGSRGTILATQDLGDHWHVQMKKNGVEAFFSVSFANDKQGCTVGMLGEVLCTSDGGENWRQTASLAEDKNRTDNPVLFTKILFANESRGWVLDGNGRLYESNDGGIAWSETDIPGRK